MIMEGGAVGGGGGGGGGGVGGFGFGLVGDVLPPPSLPLSPSSTFALASLDEEGVSNLLGSLGFPFYESQLKEHGITGEVLIHLDHEALKDVGIHSVGQRLRILKAVYALKVQQNIPIEEGHYIPPSDDFDIFSGDVGGLGPIPSTKIMGMLNERDERIRNLETEMQKLYDAVVALREDALPRSVTKVINRPVVRSPTGSLFPHPLSNSSTLSRHNSSATQKGRSLDSSIGHHPDSPRSPTVHSPRVAPDQASESLAETLPNGSVSSTRGTPQHQVQLNTADFNAPFTSSSTGVLTPTTPTGPIAQVDLSTHSLNSSTSSQTIAATYVGDQNSLLSSASSTLTAPPSSSSSNRTASSLGSGFPRSSTAVSADRQGGSGSGGGSGTSSSTTNVANDSNPYRSFRVTLEDPCYKVLPAALKKYKINDDWRKYALFICYGNTERCLAYDEKPLLLFQRLKEGNANPVFMLRHIKDIKSPIAIASAKHATRREKRDPTAGNGLERPPVSRETLPPRPTRLHFPPVLLPVGKDKDKVTADAEDEEGVKPLTSPRQPSGYCIAIYPYLAEREDEFDVAVGDSFVIVSKTKGWWVVYRELIPGADSSSQRKYAWVPSGCLLEVRVPPISLVSSSSSTLVPSLLSSSTQHDQHNAAQLLIDPNYVVSMSTPGVTLMDYEKGGSDELDVRKGDTLRVLKRYNHWSYVIKDDGSRGWIPSWFCGRAPGSSSSGAGGSGSGGGGSAGGIGSSNSAIRTGDGTPTSPTAPISHTAPGSHSVAGLSTATLSAPGVSSTGSRNVESGRSSRAQGEDLSHKSNTNEGELHLPTTQVQPPQLLSTPASTNLVNISMSTPSVAAAVAAALDL